MRLDCHRYELESASPLGARSRGHTRRGALLRVRDGRDGFGYADLHPWDELGDVPLAEQLKRLAHGETTELTRASLAFAALDAQARADGRSLWKGLTVPASHFLLPGTAESRCGAVEAALAEGFTRFKIKLGKDLDAEKRSLLELSSVLGGVSPTAGSAPRLRLDYNETLTPAQFEEYFALLSEVAPFLDFIEDPIPFEAKRWSELSARSGISFALDRAASPETSAFAGVLIHKPARSGPSLPPDIAARPPDRRLVVTSYLDHPLGQLGAAWVAAQLPARARDETHGLVSHRTYARTRFSDRLGWNGPCLLLPEGHGFGFDEELAATDWEALS